MAQKQDLGLLSRLLNEASAEKLRPNQYVGLYLQLAQAEQTSRLADAVEGVLTEMKAPDERMHHPDCPECTILDVLETGDDLTAHLTSPTQD